MWARLRGIRCTSSQALVVMVSAGALLAAGALAVAPGVLATRGVAREESVAVKRSDAALCATSISVTAPPAWPMFYRTERHTDNADGVGDVLPGGPLVRWKYRVYDANAVNAATVRWFSAAVLGDLDGDGTQEVIVTSPNVPTEEDRVIALKDVPGESPAVRAMWTYTAPFTTIQVTVEETMTTS